MPDPMRRGGALLLLLALLLTVVATNSGLRVRAQGAGERPAQRLGRQVFERSCSICHGQEGGGRIGPPLDGNLNLARSDYVTAIILQGRDGMPAFHDELTQAEIAAVANYVRSAWGNDFTGEPSDDPAAAIQEAGAEASEPTGLLVAQWWADATEGAELYRQICARCHGEDGGGGFGPPLLRNENLGDAQYVAGKILHGQGGMPAFEGLLEVEQIASVAGYVREEFGGGLEPIGVDLVASLTSSASVPGRLRVSVFPGSARLSIVGPDRFVRFASSSAARSGPVTLDGLLPGIYTVTATGDTYGPLVTEAEVVPLHETTLRLNLRAAVAEENGAAVSVQVTSAFSGQAATHPAGILYRRSCAMCHGPQGGGGVGPPLAGNSTLQNVDFVLERILHGTSVMPAFADRLAPEQIAAIATFERTSWGNSFGPVEVSQVLSVGTGEATPQTAPPDSIDSGDEIYEEYCAACHGGRGFGAVGPRLDGNVSLADLPYTVSRIVMGGGGMPSFHGVLSTAEMAQVASFIREAWGNE
ncbi:MAG TPA: c-type cytochrome, partial [Trueperaceae bacterium]